MGGSGRGRCGWEVVRCWGYERMVGGDMKFVAVMGFERTEARDERCIYYICYVCYECTLCMICMLGMYNRSTCLMPEIHRPARQRLIACSKPSEKTTSLLPSRIPTPGAPGTPLLEQALPPPLTPLCIHIPRRLHRNAGSRPSCRNLLPVTTLQIRHVDVFARIELERGLRARDVEVQLRRRVGEADKGAQRQVARVERDDVGRIEDEAVVEGGGGGAEEEGRVRFRSGGVRGDRASGDRVGV